MLTSKQRAILRKEANTLTPVFQIGKDGIDETLASGVAQCLEVRELIKIKVLETCPLTAKEAAFELAETTQSESVQVIGGKFVLYKQKDKESKYADLIKLRK